MSSPAVWYCQTMGEDKTTRPSFLMEPGLQASLMAGCLGSCCWAPLPHTSHFLTNPPSRLSSKPEQEAAKYSHPIRTINLSFPENRVVSPVGPVSHPSAWWWGWGGGDREEGMGRRAGLGAKPHSREEGSSQPPHWAGVLCLVLAATLEVLLLHNSHELWNVSGRLQHDCVTP